MLDSFWELRIYSLLLTEKPADSGYKTVIFCNKLNAVLLFSYIVNSVANLHYMLETRLPNILAFQLTLFCSIKKHNTLTDGF